jgi:hypothetical protein
VQLASSRRYERPQALENLHVTASATIAGAWLGERVFGVLEWPTELGAKALVLLVVVAPDVTGALDMYLQAHTP